MATTTHSSYHVTDMPQGLYNELASHLRGKLSRDGVTIDRNMEGQVILSGERVTPRHRTMVRSLARTMLQHG